MTIEILSTSIATNEFDGIITRYADFIITSGETAYLWGAGGLPAEGDLQAILEAREAELWTAAQVVGRPVLAGHRAKIDFSKLPGWAAWTGEEAADYISQDVLAGMTKVEIDAWVETNVTNLATAKTALKLIGSELVDLREICQNLARAVMYLRDIFLDD